MSLSRFFLLCSLVLFVFREGEGGREVCEGETLSTCRSVLFDFEGRYCRTLPFASCPAYLVFLSSM